MFRLPYLGEITTFAGAYVPKGWAACDGRRLLIADHEMLFQLVGTTYGGDGIKHFALPDLRSRLPTGVGGGPGLSRVVPGEMKGNELVSVSLAVEQTKHMHEFALSSGQASEDPTGNTSMMATLPKARARPFRTHKYEDTTTVLHPATVSVTGRSMPASMLVPTRSPYFGVQYIISLYGLFPSQS